MTHATMTMRQILEAYAALELLAGRGFKSGKVSKKIGRMFRWTKKHKEAYEEDRKRLIDGHAKVDEDGNKIPQRQRNPETGEMEDIQGSVTFENHDAFNKEIGILLDEEIATNGSPLKSSDLSNCKVIPEPGIAVGLGPMYAGWSEDDDSDDWGLDEDVEDEATDGGGPELFEEATEE